MLMLNFAPNPRYRLYTRLSGYWLLLKALLSGQLLKDKHSLAELEAALCERFNVSDAICVPQNRVGMYLTIKAVIKPGQEVIMSPYTIADITNMVICAGGRPVFADIERPTCNISAAEVERLIHPNTGAVLITHLHGLAAEAHRIREICNSNQVPLLEDCAQGFGTREKGRLVGTLGVAGIFSFGMYKNINSWLGGAVLTRDQALADKIRAELATFTQPIWPSLFAKIKSGLMTDIATHPLVFKSLTYWIFRFGLLNDIEFINKIVRIELDTSRKEQLPETYKTQFSAFQARLVSAQLAQVERNSQIRIHYGNLYYEGLKDIPELILPPQREDFSHTYTYFPIQYAERERLIRFMMKHCRDVAAQHYKNNADLPGFQEFYRNCPQARAVSETLIFLPSYPRYGRQEVQKNITVIRQFFGRDPIPGKSRTDALPQRTLVRQ
jgi:perosamine synthetase